MRKPIGIFVVHAVVLSLLLYAWPTARSIYAHGFRAQIAWLYTDASPVSVRVERQLNAERGDTTVVGAPRGEGARGWQFDLDSRALGYGPIAVFTALLIATPLAARARGAGLVVGILVLHGFALGRVGLAIGLGRAESHHASDVASAGLAALHLVHAVLGANVVAMVVVVGLFVGLGRPQDVLALGSAFRRGTVRGLGGARPGRAG